MATLSKFDENIVTKLNYMHNQCARVGATAAHFSLFSRTFGQLVQEKLDTKIKQKLRLTVGLSKLQGNYPHIYIYIYIYIYMYIYIYIYIYSFFSPLILWLFLSLAPDIHT